MSLKGVQIAVPTRGQVCWQTIEALSAVRDRAPGMPPIIWQQSNLSVAMCRNLIVERFMAGNCHTLLMVDDDVVPPPNFLDRLCPVPAGHGIVAIPHVAPHPRVPSEIILTAYVREHGDLTQGDISPGWNDVDAVATGCVAIPRAALQKLGPAPFRVADDPAAPVKSDDFLFCADLQIHGFKIGAWWEPPPAPGEPWHPWCDHLSSVNLGALWFAQYERRMEPAAAAVGFPN